ncbi:MAG: MBL fold metallo-hydrolase [Myxococcales bacterium]|nr:MAG: MBL fold metallo-hydrolase [Myxococcales bacterium]
MPRAARGALAPALLALIALIFAGCPESEEKTEKPSAPAPAPAADDGLTTFRGKPAKVEVEVKMVADGDESSPLAIRSITPVREKAEGVRLDYPPDAIPYQFLHDTERAEVFRFPEYKEPTRLTSHGYAVMDKETRETLLIDPGMGSVRMVRFWAEQKKAQISTIAVTHGHIDHTGGAALLLESFPKARFMASKEDAAWMNEPDRLNFPSHMGTWPPKPARELAGGDTIPIGGLLIDAIAMPGHTVGGLCFSLAEEKLLFCGDALFRGSIGRTDLPHATTMLEEIANLKQRLAALPDDTVVHPGHGASTTLGAERRGNPYLIGGAEGGGKPGTGEIKP